MKQSCRQDRQKTPIRCDASHMNASEWLNFFLSRSSRSASLFSQPRCTNLQNLVCLLGESYAGKRPRFRSGVAFIYDANVIVFRGLNGLRIMRDRHRKNSLTLLALLLSLSSIEKIMAHDSGDAFIHRSTMRTRPKSRKHDDDRSRTVEAQKRHSCDQK